MLRNEPKESCNFFIFKNCTNEKILKKNTNFLLIYLTFSFTHIFLALFIAPHFIAIWPHTMPASKSISAASHSFTPRKVCPLAVAAAFLLAQFPAGIPLHRRHKLCLPRRACYPAGAHQITLWVLPACPLLLGTFTFLRRR